MRAQPESFGRRFSCDALPDHFVLSQQYAGDDCGSFVHSMIVGPVGLLCPGWFDSYPAVDHRRRDSAEADQRSACLNLTWPISQAEIAFVTMERSNAHGLRSITVLTIPSRGLQQLRLGTTDLGAIGGRLLQSCCW